MNSFSQVDLKKYKGGTTLSIKVIPSAPRSAVKGVHGKGIKVAVSGVPEKGKANKELIHFLTKLLDLERNSVSLLSGEKSRDKIIFFDRLSPEELRGRLEKTVQ